MDFQILDLVQMLLAEVDSHLALQNIETLIFPEVNVQVDYEPPPGGIVACQRL
jgi:hypothetical protein